MTALAPSPQARPWEYRAFPVTVARVRRLSPGFLRLTFRGPSLRDFATWGLDQRIKLVIPMPDGSRPDFGLLAEPTPHPREWYTRWKALPGDRRNALRTYTPSAIRAESCEIDVDVFVHEPSGPASRWALGCRPGDELVLTGPDAAAGYTGYGLHFTPPGPVGRLLLVGDESALPALNNILAARPGVSTDVFLELGDPADNTLATAGPGVRVHVIAREGAAGERLETAVRDAGMILYDLADPASDSYAWIAGESSATTRIRAHLTADRGLPKERVAFLGYWKTGGPLVG